MIIWNELFKKEQIRSFQSEIFKLIGEDWILLTAGDKSGFNPMTASWGGLGILWQKPIAICFIRPTRHTYEFANKSDIITFSFLTEEYRSILQYCGSKSGKDVDKIRETGLIPVETEGGGITYKQAKLCIESRVLYRDDLIPEKLSADIDKMFYLKKDYHRFFIGEVMNIYRKI